MPKPNQSAVDKLKQFANEKVFTKEKFMQGANEFHAILEQGSSELANMLLHGHPAPIYNHSMSPAESSPEPDKSNSILDSLTKNAQEMSQVAEKEMDMEIEP